jgi:hypothetical protein
MTRPEQIVPHRVLRMLGVFFRTLSSDLHAAAVAQLVDRDVIQLTVDHMVRTGSDGQGSHRDILGFLITDPRAPAVMDKHGVLDSLLMWSGHWLLRVSDVVLLGVKG